MTKKVRVENADTADYKVVVQVWEKGATSEAGNAPDILVSEHNLDYPTAITDDSVYLTSTRYLVVKEKEAA